MLESCDEVEQGGLLRIGALGARFTALGVSHRVLGRLEQGKQLGQEGATSRGSSTSLAMLSTMRAKARLMAVTRSAKPRTSTSEITDSDEPSTVWTKTVEASLCTISELCSGNSMTFIRPGMKGSMSVLEQHAHRARRACLTY